MMLWIVSAGVGLLGAALVCTLGFLLLVGKAFGRRGQRRDTVIHIVLGAALRISNEKANAALPIAFIQWWVATTLLVRLLLFAFYG